MSAASLISQSRDYLGQRYTVVAATQRLRKGGSFLGQCCVDQNPLTPAQSEWLEQLAQRAGLPPLADGGDHAIS